MGFKVITGEAAVTPSKVLAVSFTAEKSRGPTAPPSPVKERGPRSVCESCTDIIWASSLLSCFSASKWHFFKPEELRTHGTHNHAYGAASGWAWPENGFHTPMCVQHARTFTHVHTCTDMQRAHARTHPNVHTQTCEPLAREWTGACTCTHTYTHTQLTHMQAHTWTHIHAAGALPSQHHRGAEEFLSSTCS